MSTIVQNMGVDGPATILWLGHVLWLGPANYIGHSQVITVLKQNCCINLVKILRTIKIPTPFVKSSMPLFSGMIFCPKYCRNSETKSNHDRAATAAYCKPPMRRGGDATAEYPIMSMYLWSMLSYSKFSFFLLNHEFQLVVSY